MTNKKLIVVIGPTAVGKTAVCIQLAQHYATEVVSADSRQFYKEMNIGTAKPDKEELSKVHHHLVDHLSIQDAYTVKDFETDALAAITSIHFRSDAAILAGGSGLYVKALCEGLDEIPGVPPAYRAALMVELENQGLSFLLSELKSRDPQYFEVVDKANPQRVVRALEVARYTERPFSSFRTKKRSNHPFEIIKIGLTREREVLYDRINRRMDAMIRNGLFEEAKALLPYRHLNALQTVGYTEIFDYLENKYDWEEAIRLLKRNSRRYAKRQLTWFGKDDDIAWFSPDKVSDIINYIDRKNKDT